MYMANIFSSTAELNHRYVSASAASTLIYLFLLQCFLNIWRLIN